MKYFLMALVLESAKFRFFFRPAHDRADLTRGRLGFADGQMAVAHLYSAYQKPSFEGQWTIRVRYRPPFVRCRAKKEGAYGPAPALCMTA